MSDLKYNKLLKRYKEQIEMINGATRENLRLINIITRLEIDSSNNIDLLDSVLDGKTVYKCTSHGVITSAYCKPHSINQGKFKWEKR